MTIETTKVFSSVGNYAYDPTKLDQADAEALKGATRADQKIDPQVLARILIKYDQGVFTEIDAFGNPMPPPEGPYEKVSANKLADPLAAMLMAFRSNTIKTLSEQRRTEEKAVSIQGQVFMAEVDNQNKFDLNAAKIKAQGEINAAATKMTVGVASGLAGGKAAKTSGSAALEVRNMRSSGKELNRLEFDRKMAVDSGVKLGQQRRAEIGEGKHRAAESTEAKIEANNAYIRDIDADIKVQERQHHQSETTSRQQTEKARNYSMMVQGLTAPVSSGGDIQNAHASVSSTEEGGRGKLAGGKQAIASSLKDASNNSVQNLLGMIRELLNGSVEQSGIETARALARNV